MASLAVQKSKASGSLGDEDGDHRRSLAVQKSKASGRGYQAASQATLKTAKIVDARPVHDRRHHAATTALKTSGNLAVVKQLLGHESIMSTARYAHVSDADVLAALGHKIPHREIDISKRIKDNNTQLVG